MPRGLESDPALEHWSEQRAKNPLLFWLILFWIHSRITTTFNSSAMQNMLVLSVTTGSYCIAFQSLAFHFISGFTLTFHKCIIFKKMLDFFHDCNSFYFGKISSGLKKKRNKDLRPTAMVWGNGRKKGEDVLRVLIFCLVVKGDVSPSKLLCAPTQTWSSVIFCNGNKGFLWEVGAHGTTFGICLTPLLQCLGCTQNKAQAFRHFSVLTNY